MLILISNKTTHTHIRIIWRYRCASSCAQLSFKLPHWIEYCNIKLSIHRYTTTEIPMKATIYKAYNRKIAH